MTNEFPAQLKYEGKTYKQIKEEQESIANCKRWNREKKKPVPIEPQKSQVTVTL